MALDRISEGLDAPARLVLQLAAVLGPRLNDFPMYQIVDLGIGATGQSMGALRSIRLLRETEDRMEFVNELIRGHTYSSIPKPMRTALHGEVVARLLDAEAKGRAVPGLEIAWHLIRAGRGGEATPYLLRGARESMRGGAPHEAERGLSTAMDRLEEPDKSEALLLLGEALQEQGRMNESVEFLDAVSDSSRQAVLSRRNVLRLHAEHFVGKATLEETRNLALQLLAEARSALEVNTRLRGLWMAATFFRDLREPSLLAEVQACLDHEVWEKLSIEDRGEYALGRAFCLYSSDDQAQSMDTVISILGELESQGIANSVYLRLVVGLSAIHSSLGDYEAAKVTAEKGVLLAKRIGDEQQHRVVAANLALTHCRLGDTHAQLHWAAKAAIPLERSFDIFHHIQIHHLRAQAYAVLGRVPEALAALAEGALTEAHSAHPYLRQAWRLRAADVFALLGRNKEALRSARAGVTGEMSEPLSNKFAGVHGRWSAKVAVAEETGAENVRGRLNRFLGTGQRLDRLDQAEVLVAKVWLDTKTGVAVEQEKAEMWRRLEALPTGIMNELRLLGMLDL
jgi:tetratricopeptide (TPR) repeat protein